MQILITETNRCVFESKVNRELRLGATVEPRTLQTHFIGGSPLSTSSLFSVVLNLKEKE